MAKHHLRHNSECLNCGNTVNQRYCGLCGQENVETRQSFIYLVTHFFEDLTHYEGKFWGTIRFLFFKPAFLTKQFLQGKRNAYLPPVRLYIFVSFITFLLSNFLPSPPDLNALDKQLNHDEHNRSDGKVMVISHDTTGLTFKSGEAFYLSTEFINNRALDSARTARKNTVLQMSYFEYLYHKKAIEFKKHNYSGKQVLAKFTAALSKNFPKALFIYMPLFALLLRIFHTNNKWMYFDHGIFTLHYFSFMLLLFLGADLTSTLMAWVFYWCFGANPTIVGWIVLPVLVMWSLVYFFRAHHSMYEESKWVSRFKVGGIFLLNTVLFSLLFSALVLITMYTLR